MTTVLIAYLHTAISVNSPSRRQEVEETAFPLLKRIAGSRSPTYPPTLSNASTLAVLQWVRRHACDFVALETELDAGRKNEERRLDAFEMKRLRKITASFADSEENK